MLHFLSMTDEQLCSSIVGDARVQMATGKRNDLSLKVKYEVIKTFEREPKLGVRKLSEIFQCGKTQISTILKNKEAIRELYESNACDSLCQARKRNRVSEYADLNDALYQWYQLCVQRNIYPDGSLLAEKAMTIAEHLGHISRHLMVGCTGGK